MLPRGKRQSLAPSKIPTMAIKGKGWLLNMLQITTEKRHAIWKEFHTVQKAEYIIK